MFTEMSSSTSQLPDVPSFPHVRSALDASGENGLRAGIITVFPERVSLPPPLPPKRKSEGLGCTDIMCISPEPKPFDYSTLEKGMQVADRPVTPEWGGQSPHLGHRSPGCKNRRSVVRHLSTGVWDDNARKRWVWSVLTGAALVLVVLAGLLGGLLSRRS